MTENERAVRFVDMVNRKLKSNEMTVMNGEIGWSKSTSGLTWVLVIAGPSWTRTFFAEVPPGFEAYSAECASDIANRAVIWAYNQERSL